MGVEGHGLYCGSLMEKRPCASRGIHLDTCISTAINSRSDHGMARTQLTSQQVRFVGIRLHSGPYDGSQGGMTGGCHTLEALNAVGPIRFP
jgi:hypothetical protein